MSEYGTIIVGKDNGQPPIEVTDEMLDASIPWVTICDCCNADGNCKECGDAQKEEL